MVRTSLTCEAIAAWADVHRLSDDDRDEFLVGVGYLDDCWDQWHAEQETKPTP